MIDHRCEQPVEAADEARRATEPCGRPARYVVRYDVPYRGDDTALGYHHACAAHAAESKAGGCRIARLPGAPARDRSTEQMLLRLDPDTAATIRAYARLRGSTLADVVTEAIEALIGSDDEEEE